jgi:hypothetical protein
MKLLKTSKARFTNAGGVEGMVSRDGKNSRGPFIQRHREADLGDRLTYREAFAVEADQAVVAHQVNDRGLEPDRAPPPRPNAIWP